MVNRGRVRGRHVLTALLFVISGVALFYTGLAYALSDLWHSGRTESDINAGQSAGILVLSIGSAFALALGLRASGRGSRTASIVLVIGLLAASIPWLA